MNFKTTNAVFILLILVLCILKYYTDVHYLLFILAALLYISALIYGSFTIGSNFYFQVVCSSSSGKKEIAITFDDGPVKEVTPLVLELLKEHNLKAAFFCIGKNISENESILKRMDAEGHLICNHTFSHANMFDFYSGKKMVAELKRTEDSIKNATGKKTGYFRPPFGVTNPTLKRAVKTLNYIPIGWSLRSLDTVITDEKKILIRLKSKLKAGDIVLFHDIDPKVVSILGEFIEYATENGFKIVSLDELLGIEAYSG